MTSIPLPLADQVPGRTGPPPAPGETDFSLVLCGALDRLLRRARLSNAALGLAHRRVAVAVLIMWVPLAALTALQGGISGPGEVAFIKDIGAHLRFLVVAPMLILAELVVHHRLRPIVEQFSVRRLVRPDQEARFNAALAEALRWRNSLLAEVVMIILVVGAGGLFTLRRYETLGGEGWYASAADSGRLSAAGLWLVLVSLPLLQFLLLRWYYRLGIWARFLWHVSRLDLDLNVTHPDKAGGIGFLAWSLLAFAPVAAAHGMLFSGMLADRIFFHGAILTQFQLEIAGGAAVLVLVFVGPLLVFVPMMARVKRLGLVGYGALGQDYVRGFREKWLTPGRPPAEEPLVGSADLQSLADLGNSFGVAEQMRLAPIKPTGLVVFVLAYLAPIAPLALTMVPAKVLFEKLIGLVF